jgi:benzoylformate decarboxylase
MRVSEAFLYQARELGVKRIYGNPGTTEMPLLNSLDNANLDYILLLNDGLAVASAEGESLFTSRPSIVNLHTINGLGNAIAYIYTALKDRSPVIVTAGQQDQRFVYDDPILHADLKKTASPVVKASFEPTLPEEVPKYLIRAWKVSLTPPYGPVFLSIPMNLLEEDIEYSPKKVTHIIKFGIDEELVNRIAEEMNSSKSPAIIVGYEVDLYDAYDELRDFIEFVKVPVYSEPVPNRAPFDSEHPYFIRELPPFAPFINYILKDHDLILLIGASPMLYIYAAEEMFKDKKVLEITQDPEEASKRKWDTIVCDIKELVKELKKKVKPRTFSLNKEQVQKIEPNLSQEYVLFLLKKYIGSRALFFEAVSSQQLINRIIGYKPKKYFFTRTSHLGWALPASIGYAISGGKPLVLIGDGSLQYSPQSLWTISKFNLDIKILVIDNLGYGILRDGASMRYPNLVDKYWMNPLTDPVKIGEAYGIESMSCNSLEDLERCLEWLVKGEGPRLISVKVKRKINPLL